MFDQTVIDGHVHVGHVNQDLEPASEANLLSWMDANRIDRSVLLPLESPEATSYYITSNDVLDTASSHPDRLIPFCVLDPRMNIQSGKEGFNQRVERYVERGARGFGELKVGLPIDHPRMEMLYDICDQHDLPVLLHMDHERGTDDVGLPKLAEVLEKFPDVDFICHAQAWWAHISADVDEDTDLGGYPTGPVSTPGRCGELLSTYDNCYADISAGSGWNALTRDVTVGQRFLQRHHEKLIFGTDYLSTEQDIPQLEIMDVFDLTDEMSRNVFHDNLMTVLR
jgi:predicted TIM-barrel fold metal-dependent hydrolase